MKPVANGLQPVTWPEHPLNPMRSKPLKVV
jgi:hypothetical protein